MSPTRGGSCASLRTALALCVGLAAAATGHAAPPAPGTILQQTTPPPAPPAAPGRILTLPAPQRQGAPSAVKLFVRRIVLEGNTLIASAKLLPLVQALEGKTVTLGTLDAGAERITRYYRSHGYALAYAYVPAQTIAHGVVRIAVVEPRYDKVSISGATRLKRAQAERTLGVRSGAPVEQAPLERGLLLLNQTPGIRVGGTLVPGAKPGTTSLKVRLRATPPVRGSVSLDNYGSDYTGRTRALADLSLDDPLGYGGQLAVNGLTTEGGLLHAAGFDLLSPDLHAGLRASVYGSHTHYQLGGRFAALGQTGQATQWGAALAYPLVLRPGGLLEARLDALRNRFAQSSSKVGLNDRSHVDLVRLSVDGALADATGLTSGGASLSEGRLSLDSADARAADAAGPNAAGHFWVAQLQVQREQPLPRGFRLRAALSGQLASHNLDPSEQFYLGGPYGVMSYAEGEAGGDAGALLRVKLAHAVPVALPGRLQAVLLAQYGELWFNHSTYPGAAEPNRVHLAGAGVGLDYRWSGRVLAQLDYVQRVGSAPSALGPQHRGEVWASVRVDF